MRVYVYTGNCCVSFAVVLFIENWQVTEAERRLKDSALHVGRFATQPFNRDIYLVSLLHART